MQKSILIIIFIFTMPFFIYGGDFNTLLPDHLCHIFKFLNTKDLFNVCTLNQNCNKTFELNFEEKKAKEIEEYLKNKLKKKSVLKNMVLMCKNTLLII